MSRAELLAPAGDRERLEAAVAFGADAVYLAGREFGMRAAPANFGAEELAAAAAYCHARGVRVYVTCNTIPRNGEMDRLPAFLEQVQAAGADALILADLGVLRLARRYAPGVALHVSTQAGVANYETACAFAEFGASRVVLAREMSLPEIAELRRRTPPELELEAFVHGSMCVSFSGRCLISNYLAGRDANRGECAQPCRWKYALMEEKRPGVYFPVEQDARGTYFFNSRDLCMIRHLPELLEAGVTSLKIEGRAKSAYYAAVTVNAYRKALDHLARAPGAPLPEWIPQELEKISHRAYSTGFYLGGEPGQETENGGYLRRYEVAAVCLGREGNLLRLRQRNRFFAGEEMDVLPPGGEPFLLRLEALYNEEGEEIPSAPHAAMTLYAKASRPAPAGSLLRHPTA